ncbi:MAG: sigma-54-dependent Fis family transcriptional regulator [bacterium]|nr:MAG: sigma-54-dependent Fis family transcriptional regulator [bacterium]
MADILLVEDKENPRKAISILLKNKGYIVEEAQDGQKALDMLRSQFFDLVITDVKMEPIDGMQVLKETRKIWPDTEVIVITAYGTIESAVKATKLGAFNYIQKPFNNEEFLSVVYNALENKTTREKTEHFLQKNIIINSKQMKRIFDLVSQVARTESTVLISGESGTGKELIAKAIHANSLRSNKPLITVNCSSLPENLLESELFGHVKGAFTGAIKDKKGLFQEANKGTILLDEIGEIPLQTQVKLLRVLQEGEIRRVGDNISIHVDVRIIAATNRNLEEEIEKRNFREDLYYRLNVIPIHIPALRLRKDEILPLVDHFLQKYSKKLNKDIPSISSQAISLLKNYHWPGNVRELENIIERMVTLTNKNILEAKDLLFNLPNSHKNIMRRRKKDQDLTLAEAERIHILECLDRCSGNQKLSAQMLGISTTTLWRKLKIYKINLVEMKR